LNWKFWDIVIEGIREVDQLVHHYIKAGVIDPERIGVVGTSMGGIAMFGALTQFEWIKLSVSLMGTPKYEAFARLMLQSFQQRGVDIPLSMRELDQRIEALKPYDLSQKPELIAERPMLIWHGEADTVVPCTLTTTFYNELKNQIPSNLLDVHMITDPAAGHKVPRDVCHRVVDWVVDRL
jgi:dipeptidyl aminopeptidase/acylaminoacyl peptidase